MVSNKKWRVLIVDDEVDICEVMAYSLTDEGYDVAIAHTGEEALLACGKTPPDIMVTDVRMPGMNGIELLERVKKEFGQVQVVVATAFGDMELAVRALRLDASDFITKPINNDALLVAVERAAQRSETQGKLREYTRFLEEGWDETTRELMETVAYQRSLIESSMDGILGCDVNEKVVTVNGSLEKMLGYSKTEAVGKLALTNFFDPAEKDAFYEALAGPNHGGENRLYLFETVLRTQEGRKVPVQVSATRLFEKDRPSGLVCFFRDLRKIHRLQREMADQARILHQDKMMSLGRLAASVAHEINNPLSGILNYIRLMIRITARGGPNAQQRDKFTGYLEVVEKETDRCSQIVSNLLTFSRKKPVLFEKVDITDLINRSAMLSRHKLELKNIRLDIETGTGNPCVTGDFNQLQQCLLNLIFNAIDAMPDGGELTISSTPGPDPDNATIEVTDTGTGIEPDDLPHIFEPFFTTKKEGHGIGLGLSTTFGIIDQHHGTITAESKKSRGTTFRIRLPAAP